MESLLKILDFLSFAQAEWLTKQFKVMNWNAIPSRISRLFIAEIFSLKESEVHCTEVLADLYANESARATTIVA